MTTDFMCLRGDKVSLLNMNTVKQDYPVLCYFAGKKSRGYKIFHDPIPELSCQTEFLTGLYKRKHLSVFEHVQFTYDITASRMCLDQLNRYRHASMCMESGRHVNPVGNYVIPNSIKHDVKALQIFQDNMEATNNAMSELVDLGIPIEDVRGLKGMAGETSEVFTCNLRELFWISEERLCAQAQAEIRKTVREMRRLAIQANDELIHVLSLAVPGCQDCGRCGGYHE